MFLKEAVFSRTSIPLVKKSLDACTLRARAIANNLANLTTPGYQRIDVAFEDNLKAALNANRLAGSADKPNQMNLGRPGLDQVDAVAYRSKDPVLPGEINNVDVDMEAAKLAENQLAFMFGVKFIQDRKSDITNAISGTGA